MSEDAGVMDLYAGLTIDAVERPLRQSSPDFAFRILWSCPRIGFGEVTFYWDANRLCAHTEHMSDFFLRRLLLLLANRIEIRG